MQENCWFESGWTVVQPEQRLTNAFATVLAVLIAIATIVLLWGALF